MDQNVQKGLWLAVGILLFVGVVAIGMNIFNQSSTMATQASGELSKTTEDLLNADLTSKEGSEISGSSVLSDINRYRGEEGEMILQVVTGTGNTYQYISTGTVSGTTVTGTLTARTDTSGDIVNAKDKDHERYINPSGQFLVTLAYDANDVIRAVIYTQQ